MRRMKLRRKLCDGQASIATLLDVLDHAAQADRDAIAPIGQRRIELASGGGQGDIKRVSRDDIKRDGERERELLEGVDMVLHLFNSLINGLGQGLFSVRHAQERIDAAVSTHRLSGDAK
ncbi:MAG: hypothetical protein AB7G24_00290 [Novosphingobium sp.]